MSPISEKPEGAPQRSEPENFRGRELSASLTVNDLAASVEWYRDVVGFYIDDDYQGPGTRMLAGNVAIILNEGTGSGADAGGSPGVVFEIPTAQDVDALAERVRERGGGFVEGPEDTPDGGRTFRTRDPDGFSYRIFSVGAGA